MEFALILLFLALCIFIEAIVRQEEDRTMNTETLQFGWGVSVEHDDANLISRVFDNGEKVKAYKGETAWMDAERYAYDLVTSRTYA